MRRRLGYLDIAKAICIILVVLGHFCHADANETWLKVSRFIYSFHMPLFMFASGLLFAHTWKGKGYPGFIADKFKRLMIPYFSASTVIIGIKLLMQGFLPVANKVSPQALVEMFWRPSAAIHLWFIWVLMAIFIIAGIRASRSYWTCLFILAAAVWLRPPQMPSIFCLNELCHMAVFFMGGVMFRIHGGLKLLDPQTAGEKITTISICIVSILLFLGLEALYMRHPESSAIRLSLAFPGIASVLFLSRALELLTAGMKHSLLMTIGRCSFTIFLLHGIFVEAAKAAMSMMGFTPDSHFLLCMTCTTAAGIVFPILAQKLVIEKSGVLRFLFGIK